jgi:hypothetical protein
MEHHVLVLNLDREGFCDVWTWNPLGRPRSHSIEQLVAHLEADAVTPDPGGNAAHERLSGVEVVFPAVPRAGYPERIGRDRRISRSVGDGVTEDVPQAQRPTLMRAAVADAEEVITDPEDADRAPADLDDPPLARSEAR